MALLAAAPDQRQRPRQGERTALDHIGGGKVTGTDVDDEEGKYEVEVTRGGSLVDIHLNVDFKVISDKADSDRSGGEDANDER